MVIIEITPRSKLLKKFTTQSLSANSKTEELFDLVSRSQNISKNRLRITYKDASGQNIALDRSKSLTENGLGDQTKLSLSMKDLGPQIGWRTVFLIEYFGPILIHVLFYYVRSIYGTSQFTPNQTQLVAFWIIILHFIKREYETLFVHKFSNATMPLFNIFKNSGHYWILSGLSMAFFVYRPDNYLLSPAKRFLFHVNDFSPLTVYLLVGLWAFAEISNFKTHLTLSQIRSGKDSKKYEIPYGYGFNWVACPNYFFEILSFLFYSILVGNWSSWVFLVVAAGQMWLWAVKKQKRYLKTFGDDYKKLKRKVLVPYLL